MSSAPAPTLLSDVGDLLLDAEHYVVPSVLDRWSHMRIGQDAGGKDWSNHEVFERVTNEAAADL